MFLKLCTILIVPVLCQGQSDAVFPLTSRGLDPLLRGFMAVPTGRKLDVKDVFINFYHNKNEEPSPYHLSEFTKILRHPSFNITKPSVLYAHGYVELVTDKTTADIVKAYLWEGSHNVMVLDWSNLAYGDYLTALLNVPRMAKETGRALHSLVTAGLPLESLHLVGFSLGSHVHSGASKYLNARGNKVHRLTGLDPALPGFYPPFRVVDLHITPDDAHFVDIIHSDTSFYGTPVASGHADFWPNGGMGKQPGCPPASVFLTDQYICSHRRSCRYWAESITGGQFVARSCSNYDQFLRGHCNNNTVNMGLNVDKRIRGNYYLVTAASSPFALGNRGAL